MKAFPTELLVDVFSRISFKDHVTATHVCSAWRTASHTHPAKLWSRFRVSDSETGARTLRDILKRSQHPVYLTWVPLDIHVELGYDYGHHALATIAEHMHHTRALTIWQSQRSPLLSDVALKIRAAVLLSAAPLLEHLELDFQFAHEFEDFNRDIDSDLDDEYRVSRDDWTCLEVGDEMVPSDLLETITRHWMVIPPEAFAGHAPRLRSLSLMGGFVILQDCPALANVRALSLDVGSDGEHSPDHDEELVNRTIQSVSRLPLLHHLWLSHLDMRLLSVFSQRRTIQHPLNELQIYTFHEQDPTPLLWYFNFEHAGLVQTDMYDGWMNAFETRARSAPTVLEIQERPPNIAFDLDDGDEPAVYDWCLSAADGHVWICPKPFYPLLSTLACLARNLNALSLPLAECAEFTELRFTQLDRLVIILTSQSEISPLRHRHKAPPVTEERLMHAPDYFKIECPVLRQLQLVCCHSDPRLPPLRWTVSVTEIIKFVDRHLLLSETYFERVHICNMRVNMEEGLAIASSIQTRYGTVAISSQSEPPAELVVSNSFWSNNGPYAWDEDWV